jgi:hypothetical protein
MTGFAGHFGWLEALLEDPQLQVFPRLHPVDRRWSGKAGGSWWFVR